MKQTAPAPYLATSVTIGPSSDELTKPHGYSVDELIIDLISAAEEPHPDRVRVSVATNIRSLRKTSRHVTLQINAWPSRYFDEDIVQTVQLLESGIDRLLLTGAPDSREVTIAAELLDEIESRFYVDQPLRLGLRIESENDATVVDQMQNVSKRVDSIFLNSESLLASMSGNITPRDEPGITHGTAARLLKIERAVAKAARRQDWAAFVGPAPSVAVDSAAHDRFVRRASGLGFTGVWASMQRIQALPAQPATP